MDISGQYLTYSEYVNLGGTLEQSLFNLLEIQARNQIDLRTHDRLVNVEQIPMKVKLCMFHLIEILNGYVEATKAVKLTGNVANEQIDGYSVSFVGISSIDQIISSKNTEIQDIIMTDLYGVIVNNEHIIYNGV